MEYPNDLLTFMLGIITFLSVIIGIFKWRETQVKNSTKTQVNTLNDTLENHKDINQIKAKIIKLELKDSELCDRISKMEGAFSQHNREARKD